MGAIQFISSNPTTAAIRTNEARDLQQAQAAESLLAARDARQQRADMDAAYGAAADELAAKTKPTPSALATVAPAQMYNEMGTPVPATELAKATPGATIPQGAQQQSVLSTVTADSGSGNVSSLRGMRNSGKIRFELEQAQQAQAKEAQKRADTGLLAVMKAVDDGNYEEAIALDKHFGTGQASVLNDPNQRMVVRRVIQSIPKNATAEQALAYQEAGVKAWGETFKATGDRNEADRAAGAAGIKAAMAVQGKADAYFQDDAGNVTAVRGGKATPVEGARGRTTRSAAGGGAGGSPKAVATMEWKANAYKQLGIEPNLANAIAANPGFATTPQSVQKQAQFMVNASKDIMGVPKLSMGDAVREAEKTMRSIQATAVQSMDGKPAPVNPSAPDAPQGRVRKYVPGQGFVDQQ